MGLRHADARRVMSRPAARRAGAAAIAAAVSAACGAPDLGPARFAARECVVRALTDADSGWRVSGAEDLALDQAGRVVVSAYDRLEAERAVTAGDPPPDGGVYRVAITALLAGDVRVTSLIDPAAMGGLRPHGIAVDRRDGAATLAVINRRGRAGRFGDALAGLEPVLEVYALSDRDEARAPRVRHMPAPCAANDVAFIANGATLISLDRDYCPGWAWRERLGARRARVVALDPGTTAGDSVSVRTRLGFANGLAVWPGGSPHGRIAVAETRARRVRVLSAVAPGNVSPEDISPGDGAHDTLLPTPGAPDNLTVAADGTLVAAVQPSLLTFGLYRYGRRDRAPSRIIARAVESLDDPHAPWTLLYEDATGRQFSGATAAVLAGDVMIAGSVRDEGLIVCRAGGFAAQGGR